MNQIMRIGKGVEIVDDEVKDIPAYVGRCTTSLMRLLELGDVTIKAMGNRAITNTMKTIERTAKNLKESKKTLVIDAPVFINEQVGEVELAVFNITVRVE